MATNLTLNPATSTTQNAYQNASSGDAWKTSLNTYLGNVKSNTPSTQGSSGGMSVAPGGQSIPPSGALSANPPDVTTVVADQTTPENPVALPKAPVPADVSDVDLSAYESGTQGQPTEETGGEQSPSTLAQIAQARIDEQMKAFGELETGATRKRRIDEEAQVKAKGDYFLKLQTQYDNIVADGRRRALIAEGRAEENDVPKNIYNAQVSRIERDTAIRALPLQASLAAAQGDYQMAQQHADKLFEIETADAKNQFDFKMSVIDAVYDLADKEEQRQFDQLKIEEQRKYEEEQINTAAKRDMLKMATQQGAPIGVISAITSAKTAEEAISAAGMYGGDMLARQKMLIEIENARRAPTAVIDRGDGNKQLINTQTGQVIATYGEGDLSGVEPMSESEKATKKEFTNNIANLATRKGLDSAVGTNPLARAGFVDFWTGEKKEFVADVENMLKILTLNTFAEAKAKGMTFGAMSEGEWKILGEAASPLVNLRVYSGEGDDREVVGYKSSEEYFKGQLDVLTMFSKREYVARGGNALDVGVQTTPDGKMWVKNSDGTLTEIIINK